MFWFYLFKIMPFSQYDCQSACIFYESPSMLTQEISHSPHIDTHAPTYVGNLQQYYDCLFLHFAQNID